MKALSLSEFINLPYREMLEYGKPFDVQTADIEFSYEEYAEELNLIQWYWAMCEISFNHNNVVKWLDVEVIESSDLCNSYLLNGKDRIEIFALDIEKDSKQITYNQHTVELLPRTIGELITDCQRAGIELHWRKR